MVKSSEGNITTFEYIFNSVYIQGKSFDDYFENFRNIDKIN